MKGDDMMSFFQNVVYFSKCGKKKNSHFTVVSFDMLSFLKMNI